MMETAKCKRLLYYNYIIVFFKVFLATFSPSILLIILSIPV